MFFLWVGLVRCCAMGQACWHPAALLPVLAGACVANVLGPCAALRQRTVGFYPSYRRNQGGKVFCPFPLPQIFHSILQKMAATLVLSPLCIVPFRYFSWAWPPGELFSVRRHILQAVCGVPNALLTFGKENGLSGKGGSSAGWVRPTLFV